MSAFRTGFRTEFPFKVYMVLSTEHVNTVIIPTFAYTLSDPLLPCRQTPVFVQGTMYAATTDESLLGCDNHDSSLPGIPSLPLS